MQINAPKKAPVPYTLGLDIGIASVGWALLAKEDRIIDLGVRAFNKAETAKEGDSLNLNRRMARLTRRRLQRRANRLKHLAELLATEKLIPHPHWLADASKHPTRNGKNVSTWQLRKLGLDQSLAPEEWARVIYHICKHRGFYWVSRAEQKEFAGLEKDQGNTSKNQSTPDKEQKKIKANLTTNRTRMQSNNYRTVAEMMLAEYPDAQRNKRGEYTKALPRELIAEELQRLFAAQRTHGNQHAGTELEQKILGTPEEKSGFFWHQQPPLSGAALLKMLGRCTFDKKEYRAPKHSFSAERQVWLQTLNNLTISQKGRKRELTSDEHTLVRDAPYQQKTDFTYKQLRNLLAQAGTDLEGATFSGLRYGMGDKKKNPETEKITNFKGWHRIRAAMEQAGLSHQWQAISGKALTGESQVLDDIAWVLSVYKEDDEVIAELGKLDLDQHTIDCLLEVRFDGFHHLSLKVLRTIIPYMEQGYRYDQACLEAGYHHSHFENADKSTYLPPLYQIIDKKLALNPDFDLPRNPVVLRSLNQARKLVNAVINKYGSPENIHIELARDMGKTFDDRKKIEKEQEQNRNNNQEVRERFKEHFGHYPIKTQLLKYQLYLQQDGNCPYSCKAIDLHRLLEGGYVDIDHILPWSRSYDDSKSNKVLVHTAENRNKANQTPYEYFGNDPQRWHRFTAWVNSNPKLTPAKKHKLVQQNLESEDFRERNLNDTRYACRFFKDFVESHLLLSETSKHKRCVVVSGQITGLLRTRWGLRKYREESDRHHAIDAAVVAACSHATIQRITNYVKYRETRHAGNEYMDPETGEILSYLTPESEHIPRPWAHFRDELHLRVYEDHIESLREQLEQLHYPPEALEQVKPLLVSRAPQRRNRGPAHKETIYARPKDATEGKQIIKRIPLIDLKEKHFDQLVDPHCNRKLYNAIRQRFDAFNGNAKKAFTEPVRKPDKQNNPTGPIVRSLSIYEQQSGIPIRGGIAGNASMVRVDVFNKNRKYYLVPVYVHQYGKPLPDSAVVSGKDESEWTRIDDSFDWCFSLYPNDYIKLSTKKAVTRGYFAGLDRATGNIGIWLHDRNTTQHKDGKVSSLGVKNALGLLKYNIDILGNIYPAPQEARLELA